MMIVECSHYDEEEMQSMNAAAMKASPCKIEYRHCDCQSSEDLPVVVGVECDHGQMMDVMQG